MEMNRRSIWAWGMESDEPTQAQRKTQAKEISERFGVSLEPPSMPDGDSVQLREPRIRPPDAIAAFCSMDSYDRAAHTYGRSYPDRVRAFNGQFDNPPDVVCRPTSEMEVAAVLEWCTSNGYAAVPYGGGSSVVGGVNPPEGCDGVVTIDLGALNQILEIDKVSRAARIQAGVLGPSLEAQLRPHGFTLRHFPQSFEFSSLGGWIATRSGGHYATNHTHIDDFVESVRMITPAGAWESRRLPGSGAGPSPDRIVIGSEGILGVITEAWMRLQERPRYRASAGVRFSSWEKGCDAARNIAQAKIWPANLRLLDPEEAKTGAGIDGKMSLLVIGFESAELSQDNLILQAVEIARNNGGLIDDDAIITSDGSSTPTGHTGNVGAWRDTFIRMPYIANMNIGLGLVADTFESSITWEKWPAFDASVREAVHRALKEMTAGGTLSCRFTHVYPDGPAPYYSFSGLGRAGSEVEQWQTIKAAALDAVLGAGGTVTHHHAVGRDHRPWYDLQRPGLFAQSLQSIKRSVDPQGVLNPGVLIDVDTE